MQLATLAVLSGTFTVIVVFFLVYQNLSQILSHWGQSVQMTAYLTDDLSTQELTTLESQLQNLDSFSHINFISKDEALERFRTQMAGAMPEFLSDPDFGNPLPSSFEMKLKESLEGGQGSYELLVAVAKRVGQISGVDEVSYGQGWVENYASLVSSFGTASTVLILILLGGAFFVIGNSIRNSIHQRREEIEILELFGATSRMIKAPYIFEGAIMGLLSAMISLTICYLLFLWQTRLVEENLGFLGLAGLFSYLSWTYITWLLLLGALLGAAGSYICVARLSSGWSAAERIEGRS